MLGVSNPIRPDSCSALARSSREPVHGTAPVSRAWLLLEQPGSWAADPMQTADLAGDLANELTAQSKQHGFRILLMRRSAARTPPSGRSCFMVRCTQSGTWMRRLALSSPGDLKDIDLRLLASDRPPALGEPCEPLYAVCTHGRRDPCCAEYGRRLMRRLQDIDDPSLTENLWESSHQGGHRFAANLACFPQGAFYGYVEPEGAADLLRAHAQGVPELANYRGRSAFSPVAQAADHFLRSHLTVRGLDDLRLAGEEQTDPQTHEVVFALDGQRHRVEVRVSEGPMRRESCNKDKMTPVTRYRMRRLDAQGTPADG